MVSETENALLVEKYQESKLIQKNDNDSDTESLLELLESLENDDELEAYRDQRMAQLKKEFAKIDRAIDDFGDSAGKVHFSDNEKEIMYFITRADVSIVHFFQQSFPRCVAMNKLLALFAEKHLPIQVMAIEAENAPFLVSKLRIKVLPFVLVYRKGQEIARIVGFEGIGGSEEAASLLLMEAYLNKSGVIGRTTMNIKSVRGKQTKTLNEDSDDDWY